MAKRTRTVTKVTEPIKEPAKMVSIPLTLLRQLVRQTGNRQARSFLRKEAGGAYKTNPVGKNIIEPVVVKEVKAVTKPDSEKKLARLKKVTEDKKAIADRKAYEKKKIDKNFNKK